MLQILPAIPTGEMSTKLSSWVEGQADLRCHTGAINLHLPSLMPDLILPLHLGEGLEHVRSWPRAQLF
jgi:hypothetical protein